MTQKWIDFIQQKKEGRFQNADICQEKTVYTMKWRMTCIYKYFKLLYLSLLKNKILLFVKQILGKVTCLQIHQINLYKLKQNTILGNVFDGTYV